MEFEEYRHGTHTVRAQCVQKTRDSDCRLLKKTELADRLNISLGLINRLVQSEGLPHFKIGRTIRFNYIAVLTWLNRRHDFSLEGGCNDR